MHGGIRKRALVWNKPHLLYVWVRLSYPVQVGESNCCHFLQLKSGVVIVGQRQEVQIAFSRVDINTRTYLETQTNKKQYTNKQTHLQTVQWIVMPHPPHSLHPLRPGHNVHVQHYANQLSCRSSSIMHYQRSCPSPGSRTATRRPLPLHPISLQFGRMGRPMGCGQSTCHSMHKCTLSQTHAHTHSSWVVQATSDITCTDTHGSSSCTNYVADLAGLATKKLECMIKTFPMNYRSCESPQAVNSQDLIWKAQHLVFVEQESVPSFLGRVPMGNWHLPLQPHLGAHFCDTPPLSQAHWT